MHHFCITELSLTIKHLNKDEGIDDANDPDDDEAVEIPDSDEDDSDLDDKEDDDENKDGDDDISP